MCHLCFVCTNLLQLTIQSAKVLKYFTIIFATTLQLYVGLYAYTYKVKLKLDKFGSKMQPKVVKILPFIVASGSKVCQTPRMNTPAGTV
jgi:hypothetical protein